MPIVQNLSFDRISKDVDILAVGIASRKQEVCKSYSQAVMPMVRQVRRDLKQIFKISGLKNIDYFLSQYQEIGESIKDLLSEVQIFLDMNEDQELKPSACKAHIRLEEAADELE